MNPTLLAVIPSTLLGSLTSTALYALFGAILLAACFWIFDFLTPGSLQNEIFKKNNVAAGVLAAGVMVALGMVIYASFQ